MKKILLAVCTLLLAVNLTGCSLTLSDITEVRDIIISEGQGQSASEGENQTDKVPLKDSKEQTLAEAAAQLRGENEEGTVPEEVLPPEEVVISLDELLGEDEAGLREQVKQRFLRYAAVNTASNPQSETSPSSENQLVFAQQIVEEMHSFGMSDAAVDDFGYVYGSIPATLEGQPVIGLIAHMDTAPAADSTGGQARVIEKYDGNDIVLNTENGIILSASEFPAMNELIGHELIVSDGMAFLGGDNKAGVAEIITLCEYLLARPEIEHGLIKVAVTPDKEIGRGTEHFDLVSFGADYAYTLDGGLLSSGVQSETFNGADAAVTIQGTDAYLGSAKNQMQNAALIAAEFTAMLPPMETPAYTDGYEGFYHVGAVDGSAGQASLSVMIRDHDTQSFEARKAMVQTIADYLNGRYGAGTVQVDMEDTQYNMKEMMAGHQNVIDRALQAMQDIGYQPAATPDRGNSEGAELSFKGLPCPNLPSGTANKHSIYECVSVDQMTDMMKLLAHLVYVEETVEVPQDSASSEE